MKIKLSKSQWEEMGKTAGWMKTAQMVKPQSPAANKLLFTLNKIVGEMLPDTAGQARGIINQLLELIDADFKRRQGSGQQQPQAQQQP